MKSNETVDDDLFTSEANSQGSKSETSRDLSFANELGPGSSVGFDNENSDDIKGPSSYTRAARRLKNFKTTNDTDSQDGFVELKETLKPKRATAMTNITDQRGIQIGRMFQAPTVPLLDRSCSERDTDRDMLIWQHDSSKLEDNKLEEFIDEAVGVYRISLDKALWLLQSSQYDVSKARLEIMSRRAVDEDWNDDDKILFRLAFQQYGKNFSKIHQIMPYRSIANIIQYYYQIKKRWKDSSHMQNLESVEMINTIGNNEAPRDLRYVDTELSNDNPFYNTLEEFQAVENITKNCLEGICENCAQKSRLIQFMDTNNVVYFTGDVLKKLKLCLLCRQYYLKCGHLRPNDAVSTLRNNLKIKYDRLSPEWKRLIDKFDEHSMPVNEPTEYKPRPSTIITANTRCTTTLDILLLNMDESIAMQAAECQRLEAQLEKDYVKLPHLHNLRQRAKDFKIKEKIGRRKEDWTIQEQHHAVHAIRRYGMDWDIISEILPSKTKQQLIKFYEQHKEYIDNQTIRNPNENDREDDMPVLDPCTTDEQSKR